jgi:hypothetical protein
MNSTLKVLFAAFALAMTASAFAASPASFGSGTQGFYLGADAGFGSTSCSKCATTGTVTGTTMFPISSYSTSSKSNNGFAGTIFAGYQLNQYVAFEAGWGMLPSLKYSSQVTSSVAEIPSFSESATPNTTHFYGAVKGMYPINTKWGVFGKVGYDMMSVSSASTEHMSADSISQSGVLLAAGARYTINTDLAVTASYNQLLDSVTKSGATQNVNVGYATVGLTYSL